MGEPGTAPATPERRVSHRSFGNTFSTPCSVVEVGSLRGSDPTMTTEPAALGIGLDTGGTFTDIVLFDLGSQRIVRKFKTPTTHGNYAVCIAEAFRRIGLTATEAGRLRRVVLSTTLATNAVAEEKVHPTGLVIEPGDIRVPPDFHPHLALLRSQISFDCQEVVPVSPEEVLRMTAPLAGRVESFAVSGYAATRDPVHEERIAQILEGEYGKPVVLGSHLTHRLNFLERARAAALNAGLLPVILEWLRAIQSILGDHEIRCPLYLVKSDGSLMEAREALQMPVHTLFSGPAASLHGGSHLTGSEEAIVIDVGGTTTDVGRVRNGRGTLREGGVRIEGRSLAVDGLDLATFGLGGDSRLRRVGSGGFRFENRRVLPFCRAGALYPQFSPAALERELTDRWHFGDLELLELLALDPHRNEAAGPKGRDPFQEALARELSGGPRRERDLAERIGAAVPAPGGFPVAADEAVRRRVAVWIGFTPTDLFCAEGRIPGFSQEHAQAMLELYARMLDLAPERLAELLWEAIRRQTASILIGFLAGFDPAAMPEGRVLDRLSELALEDGASGRPRLEFSPGCGLVLVGAAAPLMFAHAPRGLKEWIAVPEHGDVANAVGAIASRFVLRESATLEPLRYGGVELFDHHGKRPYPSLEEGMQAAKAQMEARLRERAAELGLEQPAIEFVEEVIEDYADYSRRTRKELVLARVEAVLTGLPG